MSNISRGAWAAIVGVVLSVIPVLAGAGTRPAIRIESLSNRADLVSGGDVLVRVSGVAIREAVVRMNGRVMPNALHASSAGSLGLLRGLRIGRNSVTVSARGTTSELTVTNHPIGGP